MNSQELRKQALNSRKLIIRMISKAGSGHPGGSLSCIDILTALFCNEMKLDPKNPLWADRDRLILSKGHGVPALYAAQALLGYFNPEETLTLRELGSPFQGHPDRVRIPSVEASTGSLGQGLSVAIGIAFAARVDKKSYRTYCVIGDGETQEGQIWEAAMCAGNYKLSNLCLFLDANEFQIDGAVKDVMDIEPIVDKFRAFKWNTIEINGHDMDQILKALSQARDEKHKPTLILARTVKGKGVSFMEKNNEWHGKGPSKDQMDKALMELDNVKV